MFEWVGDPVVNRYMPYSLYRDISQVEEWLQSVEAEDNIFAFYLKDEQKVIGSGGVGYDSDKKAYRIGYNINRAFWGKGYATEAAGAMIRWAYENLQARDFCAKHANANTASGKVLRKCGFVFERYGQYSRFDGSETFDASFYTLHLQ